MKKITIILAFCLSIINVFSQATIENGYVDRKGDFIYSYETNFPLETFEWAYTNDKGSLLCTMKDGSESLLSVEWTILDRHNNDMTEGFTVTNHKNERYFLDFYKKGVSVIIYNHQDATYSIMEGKGVNYKEITND